MTNDCSSLSSSHSPLIQHNRSYNPIAAALAGFSMNLCAVSMLPSIEHTSVERTEIDPSRILSSPCTGTSTCTMTTRRRKSERPPSDSLTDWFLVYPKARLDTSPKGSSITTAHEGREWPRRDDPNQRQPDPEADIPHIPTYLLSNQARPQYYPVTSIFGLIIHPRKMNEGLCDNTLRRLVRLHML